MTMTYEIKRKVEALKAMDLIARELVDDESLVIDLWFTYGVPDDATESDYLSIAECRSDYEEVVTAFKEMIKLS